MLKNKYCIIMMLAVSACNLYGSKSFSAKSETSEQTTQDQENTSSQPTQENIKKVQAITESQKAQPTSSVNWLKSKLSRTNSTTSIASTESMNSQASSMDLSSLDDHNRSGSMLGNLKPSVSNLFTTSKNKPAQDNSKQAPKATIPLTEQQLKVQKNQTRLAQEKTVEANARMVDGQRIIKKNLYLTQELKQLLTDPTTNKIFNKETKITTYKNDIYQIDLDMQDNVVKTMQTLTNKDDSTSTLEIYSATGRQVITNKDAYGKTTSTQTTQKVKFSGLAPWTETIISDANNQILSKKVIKTDGTSQLYTYDTTVKAQNGKSKQPATETSYDKNGNPISLQNNKPDGSYSITTYDPKIPNKIISKKSYTAPKTQGAQGTQTLGSFIKNIGN